MFHYIQHDTNPQDDTKSKQLQGIRYFDFAQHGMPFSVNLKRLSVEFK